MKETIYIKRSVKEKLPEDFLGELFVLYPDGTKDYFLVYDSNNPSNVREIKANHSHWLEEVTLEEYLKEIGLTVINK